MCDNTSVRIPLDVLLLVVLITAHLWFNQVSSAIVVTLLGVYLLLNWVVPSMADEKATPQAWDRWLFLIRLSIIFFILMVAALPLLGMNIIQRHIQGPATNVNDGLIQVEESVKFLLQGKNPYTENYLNTPLAEWKGGEPPWTPTLGPLYHNAYLPFLFLVSIPFFLLSHVWLGWYDQRLLYGMMYLMTLIVLPSLVKRQRDKLGLLAAMGLNFQFTYFLADGRNDIVVLLGLVLSTLFIAKRQVSVSALVLGLTVMTKHTAWFFVPFYFFYLLPEKINFQTIRKILRDTWLLFAVVAAILFPFLVWDAHSFFDDTIGYLIGTSPYSYPIRGWGFSTLLLAVGLLSSPYSSVPFGILGGLFGAGALVFLLARQRCENTLSRVWLNFAVLSFVVEYFSRFFNDNYVIFVLQAFVIALFIEPHRWANET